MTVDMDLGTGLSLVVALAGAWWGMARLMFNQFEKRQDERFAALTDTLAAQKTELDAHMTKQDHAMGEIRRVEGVTMSEIRRVETELSRCQVDALQRYQTKQEATSQYTEILAAIRALGTRIDQLHGIKPDK